MNERSGWVTEYIRPGIHVVKWIAACQDWLYLTRIEPQLAILGFVKIQPTVEELDRIVLRQKQTTQGFHGDTNADLYCNVVMGLAKMIFVVYQN